MRRYVASLIMSAVLAGCTALPCTLAQAGGIAAADALSLQAAALTGDSQPASRDEAITAIDRQVTPLFGMATEPVADGDLAGKWRAAQADIDRAQVVLARCREQRACPAAAQ